MSLRWFQVLLNIHSLAPSNLNQTYEEAQWNCIRSLGLFIQRDLFGLKLSSIYLKQPNPCGG